MLRTLPIDTDRIALLATGHVEPVVTWAERDGRRQPGDQERDEATGLPLWTVHALAVGGDRPETVGVRLPAATCPEPASLAPVAFERLDARVTVNRSTGQLAAYWSAAGIVDPAQQPRRDATTAA